ncbi:hypothetical protein [Roseomonas fluvialis]|uniref:Uncharacterized protein n=1 Tax=Roseomonas fluvialis TaxID=1750527 RepID=A0ABM7XXE9_9PROT|nr:hypothetical protein [Roseomonas fluvialis]BDG70142.1 hypothetical protein Rmf_00710 [Roseomonas fluvialis]
MDILAGIFALAYSGLVLFMLSASLRKLMPPMRAALTAFALSVTVHGATTLMAGPQAMAALAFWGIPHLLVLPLLLLSARRQQRAMEIR